MRKHARTDSKSGCNERCSAKEEKERERERESWRERENN
jgi:hypothetical protein